MWLNWFIIGCIVMAFFVQPWIVGDKSKIGFWIYRMLGWVLLAMILFSNDEEFVAPKFAEVMTYVCLLLAVMEGVLMCKNIKRFF